MSRRGKKYNSARQKIDTNRVYDFSEALKLALDMSYAKFDESVDVAVRLGVDPRHADQMVRGSVVLPNGTGKEVKRRKTGGLEPRIEAFVFALFGFNAKETRAVLKMRSTPEEETKAIVYELKILID